MCGITLILSTKTSGEKKLQKAFRKSLKNIRHRGPDYTGSRIFNNDINVLLGHERLAIVSPETGSQPLQSKDSLISLIVNGEIYNYKELYTEYNKLDKYPENNPMRTDCDIILHLYDIHKVSFQKIIHIIQGKYSLCLYDDKKKNFIHMQG